MIRGNGCRMNLIKGKRYLDIIRSIQRTVDKLVAWVNRWEMKFIINKCGIMHIGKRNMDFQYQVNNGWVK